MQVEKSLNEDYLYRPGSGFPIYSLSAPILQCWISGPIDTFTTAVLDRPGVLEALHGLVNRVYTYYRLNNQAPEGNNYN